MVLILTPFERRQSLDCTHNKIAYAICPMLSLQEMTQSHVEVVPKCFSIKFNSQAVQYCISSDGSLPGPQTHISEFYLNHPISKMQEVYSFAYIDLFCTIRIMEYTIL